MESLKPTLKSHVKTHFLFSKSEILSGFLRSGIYRKLWPILDIFEDVAKIVSHSKPIKNQIHINPAVCGNKILTFQIRFFYDVSSLEDHLFGTAHMKVD